MTLGRRAVELDPDNALCVNALGYALYATGRFKEAIAILERSLAAGHIRIDSDDLFYLAMAHHRLGQRAEARAAFDRGVRWLREKRSVTASWAAAFAARRAAAEAVLAGPAGELPEDVFARPR